MLQKSQEATEGGGEAAEPERGFSLASPQYWGVMVVIMSLYLAFSCVWRPAPKPAAGPAAPLKVVPKPVVQAESPPPKPAKVEAPVPAPLPRLKISGLLYRETEPAVLIEGKAYYVGDAVSGAKILSITRELLTVEYAGSTSGVVMPW